MTRTFRMSTMMMTILLLIGSGMPGTANAKSLYVINQINNSTMQAYDISITPPPYLTLQHTSTPSSQYGAVGLAIDSDAEILFVTFETFTGPGKLQIVDAQTLTLLGTLYPPNATNLAGVVYDHDNGKLYCVDRGTNHLYVYTWNASTYTLTNDITTAPYYVSLPGVSMTYGAHGIALDETNDLLYLGDASTTVKVYNTSTWTLAGTETMSQAVMGIAVDVTRGYLYTGSAYYGSVGKLCQLDMATDTEVTFNVRTYSGNIRDNVAGIAVDQESGLVYITTGNQASGASNQMIAFNTSLQVLQATGNIGNPTGIAVPCRDVSYNPLNLVLSDNPSDIVCPGGGITYTYTFDNTLNTSGVTGVTLTAYLSSLVSYSSCTGGGTYNAMQHKIVWSIGSLAAGATAQSMTVDVVVSPMAPWHTVIPFSAMISSVETGQTTRNESTTVDDVTAPTLSISLDHTVLWPPNHRLWTINATVGVTDNCTYCSPSYTLVSVTSNEPDNGLGDGDTEGDIVIVSPTVIKLRAERSGLGSGRVYTISYLATDCHGNTTPGAVTVTVPHDMDKNMAGAPNAIATTPSLEQNYPNPFNPTTLIGFGIPEDMHIRLSVFDLLGREVALITEGRYSQGNHVLEFDARTIPSGVYLYRLETPNGAISRIMLCKK